MVLAIMNTKDSTIANITQLKVKESLIDNPKRIAEEVNDYFVNVGPKTEESIPINPVTKPIKYLKNRNQVNFLIAQLSNEEVLDIINNLENKSTGLRSIPIKLLKLIPDLINIPLCKVICVSLSTGKYPDALKICKTMMIQKGGGGGVLQWN